VGSALSTGRPAVPSDRRIVTDVPGPRSLELAARRALAVPAAVGTTLPVYVQRAADGLLEDVDGNCFVDLGSGISVTNVGNSAPEVVAAVAEQLPRFTHTCFQVTPYEGYVAVCERLNALTPGHHAKRSLLVNSGAEAVENAVKIARYATRRQAVVAFDHGFHGRTLLAMSLTGKAMPYKHGFGPFAPEVYRAPYSDPFRHTGRLEDTISWIETMVAPEDIACVVVEPICGEGGFVVPEPGWLSGLARWCGEHGVLVVADEVQTGMGRTGAWFACAHEHVVPDLVVTAKSLGGGLPLGAVTGRAELMDAVHPGGLGGTFGGNPLACAASLAVFEAISSKDLLGRARHIEQMVLPRLQKQVSPTGPVGDARGRGAMLAVELVAGDGRTPAPQLARAVAESCHRQGVLMLTAGTYGNVIRLLPPLVISDGLLDDGLGVLESALEAI